MKLFDHAEGEIQLPSNRKFGLVFAGFFLILGFVSYARTGQVVVWEWGVSGLFFVGAVFVPRALTPLNKLWMKFGELLHAIVNPLVLSAMFLMVVVVGLVMRLFGKRPIPIHFDPQQESYWVSRQPPGPKPETLDKQY